MKMRIENTALESDVEQNVYLLPGRKPIILNMVICLGILDAIMALSPSVELLIVCRFLGGMCYAVVTGVS